MGRALLVGRLAVRDIRRRPAEAALLLLAIMAATTTLTLALVLHGAARDPYQRTREATAGPDVVASTANPVPGGPADLAALEALTDAPGVVAHSGPFPVTSVVLEAPGETGTAVLVGRDVAPAAVDQPQLTDGSWIGDDDGDGDGEVVVEAAFADALGIGAGDPISLAGRPFEVVGVAVTAATPPYPDVSCLGVQCRPGAGLVWLTQADAISLAPAGESLAYVMNLQLADPAAAPAFVAAYTDDPPVLFGTSWQRIVDQVDHLVRNQRRLLLVGSSLLGILAVASVAVLVGGRMADQIRRVGLLKAVGGTPSLAAAVLLAEYLAVALLAGAGGLAAGWSLGPVLADPSVGLVGGAGVPPLTPAIVGQVTGVALAVAVVATLLPAVHASRTSTIRALADSANPPQRTAWLIAVSARLPVPLLLGLRLAARRPRRVVLGVVSVTITVSGIVAALGAHADLGRQPGGGTDFGVDAARADRLNQVLLVITLTLVALAAVNALFVTWATALDARHSSALSRALGATPGEVSAGLAAAQVVPAIVAATLGIPVGLGLLDAVDPEGATIPPLWQLLSVVPATALLMGALITIPARLGARRPVAPTLQSEFV